MNNSSKNSQAPQPYQYISKSPTDTRLSRCSCSSCRAQKRLAVKGHGFFPSKLSAPFRTGSCKRKKQQKNVLFDDDVQVFVYDKKTGSVFEKGKTDLIKGKPAQDIDNETSTAHLTPSETNTNRSKDGKLEKLNTKKENKKRNMKRNKTGDTDQSSDKWSGNRKNSDIGGSKRKGKRCKKQSVKTKNRNEKRVDDSDVVVL